MRIIRVKYNGVVFYASLSENTVHCLHSDLHMPESIPLGEVSVLPLVAPSKVVCVGLNYRAHAEELGFRIPTRPEFFLKPPTALLPHGQPIILPHDVGRIDAEAELALVMGQTCRNVSVEQAERAVFGYTCANDVTAREIQRSDSLIGHCKSYDTFCPIGPWLETEPGDISNLRIRCLVNDEVRQDASTADMIFSPLELVSFLSRVMTLLPGDVILTGTPVGVSPIVPDDRVRVEIESVGVLMNGVAATDPDSLRLQ